MKTKTKPTPLTVETTTPTPDERIAHLIDTLPMRKTDGFVGLWQTISSVLTDGAALHAAGTLAPRLSGSPVNRWIGAMLAAAGERPHGLRLAGSSWAWTPVTLQISDNPRRVLDPATLAAHSVRLMDDADALVDDNVGADNREARDARDEATHLALVSVLLAALARPQDAAAMSSRLHDHIGTVRPENASFAMGKATKDADLIAADL